MNALAPHSSQEERPELLLPFLAVVGITLGMALSALMLAI